MNRNPALTWTSDALERNDVAAVMQRALTDPAYLTTRDYFENTPLLTAISFGSAELVEFLLKQGADPNVEVDDGYMVSETIEDGANTTLFPSLKKNLSGRVR